MTKIIEKKGIGIIGYGGFGEFIHQAWNKMDNAHVTAICDSILERNPKSDAEFYLNIDDFLYDKNVDIVSIATPPSTHVELAIKCMEAGKHVLIEKPLAFYEKDAIKVIETSEKTKRAASVNFVLRYNPIVDTLKEIINSEVLGKLRRIDLRNYATSDSLPKPHWFWNPNLSGRILIEHGVHFFDMAYNLIGSKAKDVFSFGIDREEGMEDKVFAAVVYENNIAGTFWHSFSRPRQLETTTFHFAFDLGELEMVGWIPLELSLWGWVGEDGYEKLKSIPEIELMEKRTQSRDVLSSGITYKVDYDIDAKLVLIENKSEVYAESLRQIMGDLIKKIEDPNHKMKITLEDALESVRISERATRFTHPDF
ncbi:MAG: Gfo/Idh/MocA family oxidoreductase [Armatimonadota bacterium]